MRIVVPLGTALSPATPFSSANAGSDDGL